MTVGGDYVKRAECGAGRVVLQLGAGDRLTRDIWPARRANDSADCGLSKAIKRPSRANREHRGHPEDVRRDGCHYYCGRSSNEKRSERSPRTGMSAATSAVLPRAALDKACSIIRGVPSIETF
ncbi:hypothetical protein EVAR_45854_1 [Eumeta japonica]|uniref:Uncharacterized protein n=1 Tax=Eumeta variegata TaxID=151549 RepID=A0A4C1WPF2_EUMVA|nr:hypothetical protein EVAR_45854_1 [Eumeta japonica]